MDYASISQRKSTSQQKKYCGCSKLESFPNDLEEGEPVSQNIPVLDSNKPSVIEQGLG
jgi:hypothetical protein